MGDAAEIPNVKTSWKFDGDLFAVAKHGVICAKSWEPSARLIGNCRACDLQQIFKNFIEINPKVAIAKVIANNALYFCDTSDYRSAFYEVCKALGMPEETIGKNYME